MAETKKKNTTNRHHSLKADLSMGAFDETQHLDYTTIMQARGYVKDPETGKWS